MTTKMTFRASGIIVPLLTPIHADESVDFEQLDRLIEHVLAGGVNALLIMGSTGEFARFDADTRSQILARAVRKTAGAAPVYAGVGDAGTRAVLRNIRLAEQAGVDAVAATLPYYYPVRTDAEAFSYYAAVAESTRLPVMLYNIPGTCIASLSLEVVESLLRYENVVGIKDSAGDLPRLLEELRRFKNPERDFAVVVGSEELSYDGLKAGADGLVPSLANPFPRLFAGIWLAARDGDWETLRWLCASVDEMNRGNHAANSWMAPNAWRKRALARMGVCNDRCTQPYLPVDEKTDREIAEAIERYEKKFPSP